jgi:hypothetical protein
MKHFHFLFSKFLFKWRKLPEFLCIPDGLQRFFMDVGPFLDHIVFFHGLRSLPSPFEEHVE